MDILKRINIALNEAKKKKKRRTRISYPNDPKYVYDPTVVDMSNQADKMSALRNCRGPCVGWEEYVKGNDYIPPMYYKNNVPYGPKDTGKKGITSSTKEADEISFNGVNPYSKEHDGIRPWAPGEVLLAMMHKSIDKDERGGLHRIATKQPVVRAAKATHGKYDESDVDNSIQQGAIAILQMLPKDEARPNVRFTGFVGHAIEQAMKAGAPAGYGDEYRRVRGLKRSVQSVINKALRDAGSGRPLDDDAKAVEKAFDVINICPRCKGTGFVDVVVRDEKDKIVRDKNGEPVKIKERCSKCGKIPYGTSDDDIKDLLRVAGDGRVKAPPGPLHPFGDFPPELFELRDNIIRAIKTGDVGEIRQEQVNADKIFDRIGQEEKDRLSPGLTTQGAVGKKPREYGTLKAFKDAEKFLRNQRTLAEKAKSDPHLAINAKKYIDEAQTLWKEHTGKLSGKMHNVAYEQPQEDLPESPGFVGLKEMRARLEKALESADPYALLQFILMSYAQQEVLRIREEVNVRGTSKTGLTVRSKKTGKEYERQGITRPDDDIAKLQSPEVREVLRMAIEQVSPNFDPSKEKRENAAEASKLLDALATAVDDYVSAESQGLDTTKARRDFADIERDVDSSLGEWREEINELLEAIAGTIQTDGKFGDIRKEIRMLQKIAKQDIKLKPSSNSVPMHQYRMLLRLYGISDYPERGTPDDPEIDAQGGKSRWAEAGYPPLADAKAGRQSNVYLWNDIFETTDDEGNPIPSVSNAYICKQRKEATLKFKAAAHRLWEQVTESCGSDSVESKIFMEFDRMLCRMIIEDVLPGRAIYG
jgi:hypothetical protein